MEDAACTAGPVADRALLMAGAARAGLARNMPIIYSTEALAGQKHVRDLLIQSRDLLKQMQVTKAEPLGSGGFQNPTVATTMSAILNDGIATTPTRIASGWQRHGARHISQSPSAARTERDDFGARRLASVARNWDVSAPSSATSTCPERHG
jgi:hypothetical protein